MKKTQNVLFFILCGALSAVLLTCASTGGGQDDGFGPGVPYVGEWYTFTDENDKGNSTVTMEELEIDGMRAYKFTGNVTTAFQYGFIGWFAEPDEATLELLKKARAISFRYIGDGQRMTVKYRISSVRDHAHFEYHFFGEPGEKDRVEVPIRFFQQPSWGTPVRFNQANAEDVSFQTHESWRRTPNNNPFTITIWDLRIHP